MSNPTSVQRISKLTGKTHSFPIPLSKSEFEWREMSWIQGTLIQNAFPMLTNDQREYIMSGITPNEWIATFGEDE